MWLCVLLYHKLFLFGNIFLSEFPQFYPQPSHFAITESWTYVLTSAAWGNIISLTWSSWYAAYISKSRNFHSGFLNCVSLILYTSSFSYFEMEINRSCSVPFQSETGFPISKWNKHCIFHGCFPISNGNRNFLIHFLFHYNRNKPLYLQIHFPITKEIVDYSFSILR